MVFIDSQLGHECSNPGGVLVLFVDPGILPTTHLDPVLEPWVVIVVVAVLVERPVCSMRSSPLSPY